MHDDWHEQEKELDRLLSDYYGPALDELPLPTSAWLDLQWRLDANRQHEPVGKARWRGRRHVRWRPRLHGLQAPRVSVPLALLQDHARICALAQVRPMPSRLRYRISRRPGSPTVRVSFWLRPHITLTFQPGVAGYFSQTQSLTDVLIATGIARYQLATRWDALLRAYLLLGIGLLCPVALLVSWRIHMLLPGGLTALFFLLISWCLLGWHTHRLALKADQLAVHWLGRSQVCQGLHELARSSRSSERGHWGEPSLALRMRRVCNTSTLLQTERLTMVH